MKSYQSIDRERMGDQSQVEDFLCGLVVTSVKMLLYGAILVGAVWLICEKQIITSNRPAIVQK
jgi:hypothetical protein